jgi:transposase
MEPIIERCAGLDVHQATVVACYLGPGRGRAKKEVRSFGTMTRDLTSLRDWLTELGVTHVGMESTGIYWVPVFRMLEGHFELVVGNATHIKAVPGRKTDVKDSEWIADLVRHGLIRRSFVPPPPIRELRELTRYRRKLTQDQARERNRIQKLLETAGIKLASVASNVFGASGRAMLADLAHGATGAVELARHAKGRLRNKIPELVAALEGRFEEHHRFLLGFELERLAEHERALSVLDAHIESKLTPYESQLRLLTQIPGVDRIVAGSILAELGPDMTVFPSERHAAAWAGVSPGCNESGGKRRASGARKGNIHLTTTLCQAACSAVKKRGTYLRDKYWRLKARRGAMRALIAIAHKILIAAYHVLHDAVGYVDLGGEYLRNRKPIAKRVLVHQLEALGYEVTLTKKPT